MSDFAPQKLIKGKLKSGRPYILRLKALPKISADIRRLAPESRLVLFKLESGLKDEKLISRAKAALISAGADLIVANSFGCGCGYWKPHHRPLAYRKPNYGLLANRIEPRYKAYILDAKRIYSRTGSKQEMVRNPIAVIGKTQKERSYG